ncbi:hypothetical protein Patl1_24839 [Pistacia atlantica]|uniref:Uncharacterized protein n=1 Tax=Pistacia atlantica TaxID=434234 RepID=A0ACC1AZK8_9ROSI|nr:hypothetical protein Patl1_24839 [Pistacia atlantica]
MQKTLTFLLLFLLLFLSVHLQLQCEAAAINVDNDDLIEKICRKTPFHDLCVATLQPIANTPGSNIKGLASSVANIVLGNATDTLHYIEGLIKQTSDPKEERALAECAELYISVVKYELPQAIEALSKGQYGFANYGISDAAKLVDQCDKGFPGKSGSPLSDRNKLIHSLSQIAVAIINVLAKG